MRGKGSRFILGVWGLRVCSLDVAFASATVRNRPQPFASVRVKATWPRLWRVLQKAVIFRGSKRRVASFCVASVAFCDISTSFITCRKLFCMACAFSEDELHFSWQAQRVGDHHRHFAWQAQHFRRVELHVFCEPHCQGCVKW